MNHNYQYPAIIFARAAIKQGPMEYDGYHKKWNFNGRRFSAVTINRLITEGSAVRIGNHIKAKERT